MLEVRNLTKHYRNKAAVDHLHFTVRRGEVTGYLGPNGSGKSTTVKMIAGLIEPTAGTVLLDGCDVREDRDGFRRRLGYVPEEAILYPYLSGLEYLQLIGRLRGLSEEEIERRANELLALFSLAEHRHSSLSAYSKGMRQRVLIASALLHNPDLLILDEPLSGMDVASAELFKHLLGELAARGKMILYISHVLEVVEKVCARVIVIHRGRIVADDSVAGLQETARRTSLVDIFAELTEERDVQGVARDIAGVVCGRGGG